MQKNKRLPKLKVVIKNAISVDDVMLHKDIFVLA